MSEKISEIFKLNFQRISDNIFRYGGEEFVIYYLSKNKENFFELLENLRKKVKETPILIDGKNIHLTISIGAVSKIPQEKDYNKIIKKANDNLYMAKNLGRDRTIINQ
nr:GGDEF domain-containing protein [Thermosipho globiformans]